MHYFKYLIVSTNNLILLKKDILGNTMCLS